MKSLMYKKCILFLKKKKYARKSALIKERLWKNDCFEEYHTYKLNVCQSHAFKDYSCLVKETIGRVMTFWENHVKSYNS